MSLTKTVPFDVPSLFQSSATDPALVTEFAAKNPETIKKALKGIAEALKAAIADPGLSIAAIKKREPLVDEKVERARLELVIKHAIVTDRVRR